VGDGSCLGKEGAEGGLGCQACKINKGTIGSGSCIVSLFSKWRLFSCPACFHANPISMCGSVLMTLHVPRFGAPMYTSQGEGTCTGNTGSIGSGTGAASARGEFYGRRGSRRDATGNGAPSPFFDSRSFFPSRRTE